MNEDRTRDGGGTKLTQPGSRPVRFALIDKDGNAQHGFYADAYHAAVCAKVLWPDQEQDEDRSGNGWDIEAVR